MSDITNPHKYEHIVDDELFYEMRKLFLAGNHNTIINITQAIVKGQIADAHRLAHTLRSSAMMIGMTHLGNIAHEAEGLLKSGIKLPQELLNTLEAELSRVLNELMIEIGED